MKKNELPKFEQMIVLLCKNHYCKQMPKGMTIIQALKIFWMIACGHDEPYDSSLEHIARRLHCLATTLHNQDYVMDEVHRALMGNTMLVHSDDLKPIERVIKVYASCIAFTSVRDEESNLIINLPDKAPHKTELKRIFKGDFTFEDYKIFKD